MSSSAWVQDKIELGIEGELLVFRRPNSPNFYMRIWIQQEGKYFQKSLKTKSQYEAVEKAKAEYKLLQQKVSKEEKVFAITFAEALEGYFAEEKNRERRGLIKNDWLMKKQMYLKNTFLHHFGNDTKANNITDKQMEEYIDIRLKRCKRKQTIIQELTIIKHFYKTYLIKKGWVAKAPEFPVFRLKGKDRAKREDTFTLKEYDKLVRFMREWVKPKNISKVRTAEKAYGKKDNKEKLMNEWEYQMEIHRRILIRELILIGANSGIRCPKEMLSLKWGDIRIKKEKIEGQYNSEKEIEQYTAYIRIGEEQKTGSRVVVALAGSYFNRLREYLTQELGRIPADDEPVFMELYGRRKFDVLDKYALYRIWGELMRDCGLTRLDFTPYCLRGFYITQSILNGYDLVLIAKNAGNSINTISNH
ncbi:site-specific integrase, partial [bacterium]|nr:site-specific integrase [bacterium]